MSIPSINTRHKLYKQALKDYKSFPIAGLCLEMDMAIVHFGLTSIPRGDLDIFPEISKHRPAGKKDDDYWWSTRDEGIQIRIDILEQAIRETSIWYTYYRIFKAISPVLLIMLLMVAIMFTTAHASLALLVKLDMINPAKIRWNVLSTQMIMSNTIATVAMCMWVRNIINNINKSINDKFTSK